MLVLTLSLISTSSLATLPLSQWPVSCLQPDTHTHTAGSPLHSGRPEQQCSATTGEQNQNRTNVSKPLLLCVYAVTEHNASFSLHCVTCTVRASSTGAKRDSLAFSSLMETFIFYLICPPLRLRLKVFTRRRFSSAPPLGISASSSPSSFKAAERNFTVFMKRSHDSPDHHKCAATAEKRPSAKRHESAAELRPGGRSV